MRKNMEAVLDAFNRGHKKGKSDDTCSTNGSVVYSYKTPIAFRAKDGSIVVNGEKYSHTTSTQQTALRVYFGNVTELPDEVSFKSAMRANI